VFERLEPKPRQRAIPLDIPDGASRLDMMERIFRLMADGEIAPDEALQIARLIDKLADARARDALQSACTSMPAPHQESLPRAKHGEGQGGGPDVAETPARDETRLHSTCISTPPAEPAARTVAPSQPSPMLRTGEGLRNQAPRPRRGRIVYWDGSQGPAAP